MTVRQRLNKFWNKIAIYVQLCGAFSGLVAIIFLASGQWQAVQASIGDVSKLMVWHTETDRQLLRIEQKLDDIILYWNVPHKETKP